MHHLGSLNGRGHILTDGKRHGPFDYALDVWQAGPGGDKSASGTFAGGIDVLQVGLTAKGQTVLELERGGSVKVVITHASSDGRGQFEVSGPVPGF